MCAGNLNFKKEITSLKTLGTEFRQAVLIRLGEEIARNLDLGGDIYDHKKKTELFLKLAQFEVQKSPKTLTEKTNDIDFMTFVLEDYQIVLTNSISSDRILNVLPQGDEFGRVTRLREKYGT